MEKHFKPWPNATTQLLWEICLVHIQETDPLPLNGRKIRRRAGQIFSWIRKFDDQTSLQTLILILVEGLKVVVDRCTNEALNLDYRPAPKPIPESLQSIMPDERLWEILWLMMAYKITNTPILWGDEGIKVIATNLTNQLTSNGMPVNEDHTINVIRELLGQVVTQPR